MNHTFCITPKKDGCVSRKVADLSEFWTGQKKISLLDQNLLACKERIEILNQLAASGAEIDFKGGLDARFVNEEVIAALRKIKVRNYFFAWDDPREDLEANFEFIAKSGIKNAASKVAEAAKDVAKSAINATKKILDINSPSKVFRKIGGSIPEGFAQGIDRLGGLVSNSAANMGKNALSATSDAISRISNAIDSDMDTQPTIRPVLDLSDIKAGSGMIGDLLGYNHNVGLMANVNAISSSMNTNQNGGNDDVVSAIKDLKRSINNLSGDTYQINGVTYDDGSNISNAVKSIVRAARVERRV